MLMIYFSAQKMRGGMKNKRLLLVVFSAMVRPEQLDGETAERCRIARRTFKRLLTRGMDVAICCVGGIYYQAQTRPAADMMADMLVRGGVPRDRIACETQSLETADGVANVLGLLKQWGPRPRIVVISNPLHCVRVQIIFWRGFGIWVKTRPSSALPSFKQLAIECIGIPLALIDPLGNGWINRYIRRRRLAAPARPLFP